MDINGYPEDDELETIRKWDAKDPVGLFDYVIDRWKYDNYTSVFRDENRITYALSTGGWSGNEELIGAIMDNKIFWLMYWWSSRRGGYYEFRVNLKQGA